MRFKSYRPEYVLAVVGIIYVLGLMFYSGWRPLDLDGFLLGLDRPVQSSTPPGLVDSIVYGGDVFLARRAHYVVDDMGYDYPLGSLRGLFLDSGLSLVNLESVITDVGEPADKGERNPYYFRARPDLVNVLVESGVDVVNSANNHAGDYGPRGVARQMEILEKQGIGYVGIGGSLDEAESYRIFDAGSSKIALIGLQTTMKNYVAGSGPGTNYHPANDPDGLVELIAEQVDEAEKMADMVFLTVHWGGNGHTNPTDGRRQLAKRLVEEAGVDAILGHSAHMINGMEWISGVPVLYDCGNLMLDYGGSGWNHKGVLFKVFFDREKVLAVKAIPLILSKAHTEPAEGEVKRLILERLEGLSIELDPSFRMSGDGIMLSPGFFDLESASPRTKEGQEPYSRGNIRNEETLDSLPSAATEKIHEFNDGVRLLGFEVEGEARHKRGFFLTTYWRIDEKTSENYLISIRVKPVDEAGPTWTNADTSRDHHPGDWTYPTYLWKPGEIITDRYFIRAHRNSAKGRHQIYVGVYRLGEKPVEALLTEINIE